LSKVRVKEKKAVSFSLGVDDTIILLVKQKTSEFTIIHNNDLACECNFCIGIKELILELSRHITKPISGSVMK